MNLPDIEKVEYVCCCGWQGKAEELHEKIEYPGDLETPPEFSFWCPACITSGKHVNVENMQEVDVFKPERWEVVVDRCKANRSKASILIDKIAKTNSFDKAELIQFLKDQTKLLEDCQQEIEAIS